MCRSACRQLPFYNCCQLISRHHSRSSSPSNVAGRQKG
uniref:Uncharacterized protein n=1 Tax=Physcomitrium patens TaxID=3218 RepID=A0A2K1JDA7_PHYPA|nr:hypothetical protein PHYPA_019778 [Physcomitrium patens]